ncbi:HesB/YadR/YfhF family protein [Virgibacillus natechei]|uniref:HesB/YadR/YfhF family protein n=1 Tax=Virgibacillus natechei TaxID=1216297 RepID=UPI001FD98484|nr:hypothetical protein [Virgibacillus natechei]
MNSLKLQISKEAAKWYQKELDITEPTYLRFYVRYGGFGGNIPGFSLGIKKENPENIYSSAEIDNIIFYIESKDVWYFEDNDLKINMNRKLMEPDFKYI